MEVKILKTWAGNFDVEGESVRTKESHPYNHDPILVWSGPGKATSSVYSDRLFQWNFAKHDALCQVHFGNQGQWWGDREPVKVEAFLREYLDFPDLKLVEIFEECNASRGTPVWVFHYYRSGSEPKQAADSMAGAGSTHG